MHAALRKNVKLCYVTELTYHNLSIVVTYHELHKEATENQLKSSDYFLVLKT